MLFIEVVGNSLRGGNQATIFEKTFGDSLEKVIAVFICDDSN